MNNNIVVIGNNCAATVANNELHKNTGLVSPLSYGGILDLQQVLELIENDADLSNVAFYIDGSGAVHAKINEKIDVCYIHYTNKKYADVINHMKDTYSRRLMRFNSLCADGASKVYLILMSKLCHDKQFHSCVPSVLERLGKIDNVFLATSTDVRDNEFVDMFNCKQRTLRVRESGKNTLWRDAGLAFAKNIDYMLYHKTKNIGLDELVQNSFVLSINQKRLDFFYEQWKASGLPLLPKKVACIQLRKNNFASKVIKKTIYKDHISVMSTHLMIVSMAQAMGLPFVCVFEDDAVGCIGVKDRLQELLLDVPDDTDIAILGNCKTFGVRKDLQKWVVPTKTFGLQAYICMQKNYERFLNSLASNYESGLTACGENVYLAKDIVFCQYSLDGSMNLQWHKDERGFFHSSLSKDYIDKHFKVHCHSMTFNGGRLGNQLYYALQAYIQNKIYVVTSIDSQAQYENLLTLGCKDLISDNSNEFTSKIDNYCQHINKDFTIEQLNSFIDNVLLKSDFFKDMSLDSTSFYVHIRNGDYISNSSIKKVLASFDRHKYLDNALKAASSTGMQKLVVVSDDIQACKQYESIFKKYASDIQYVCSNVLDDFKLLCGAKNKIIMNSTFSIWSSFISNRLFKDSEKCIYVPSVWSVNSSIDKCFQHITTRANKEWNIVDVEYTNAAVVKRTDYNAGFCSYLYTMFAGICWCIEHGYKPIIDMQTSDNAQFHDSQSLNNVNVWENIFEQPSHLSLNDVNNCKSIYFAKDYFTSAIDKMSLDVLHDYARKYLRFKKEILDKAEKFYADNMSDNTVGIMIRGTDRTFIAYPGHKVQQSYNAYIDQLNSILKDSKPDKIYLMTESEEYFNRFKKDFPESVSYQSVHLPENGQTIAQILKDKPYEYKAELLEQYVVSLLLLAKCRYVILGQCSACDVYKIIRQQPAEKTIVLKELNASQIPNDDIVDIDKNSYSLTVDKRKYEYQCNIFKKYGIHDPIAFNGIRQNDYIKASAEGHKRIIFQAKQNNLPYCVVFEDDAYPCNNCKNDLIKLLLKTKDVNWDILVLGITGEHFDKTTPVWENSNYTYEQAKNTKNVEIMSDDLIKIHRYVHGSHAYIVKCTAYDSLLKVLDGTLASDYALGSDLHKGLNVYVTRKMFFCQHSINKNIHYWYYPCFYNEEEIQLGPLHYKTNRIIPKGFSIMQYSLAKNAQRFDIINTFIEKYSFQSYLEIGVSDGFNFNRIHIKDKVSIDPSEKTHPTFKMTSDEFFKQHADMKFDIVFIDGLHHSDQLLRDIENSLRCLNEGGVIVCHDCLPGNEHMQTYEIHKGAWTGDCWKAFAKYRKDSLYECYVLDCDHGCGVIDTNIVKTSDTSMIKDNIADMIWNDFVENKVQWLNVKSNIL